MDVRLKRAKELAGYAVRLTKDEGLPTMVKRGAGFVRRRFFGKRARYLTGRKVLEAQRRAGRLCLQRRGPLLKEHQKADGGPFQARLCPGLSALL